MEETVAKYAAGCSGDYLLPILKLPSKKLRSQYKSTLFRINKYLKEIARLCGIAAPLTMYVSRHSWASIAKSKNIPISVISEGMGHDSEETTRIYLASLDGSVIDKANLLILKGLVIGNCLGIMGVLLTGDTLSDAKLHIFVKNGQLHSI